MSKRLRLGQHFLVDSQVADRIVAAAEVQPGDEVIEIGPGRGVLTRRLLDAGARVTAVELDARLCEALSREFLNDSEPALESGPFPSPPPSPPIGGRGKVRGGGRLGVLHSDFLKLEPGTLPFPCAFVANLPYAVASPILQRILAWPGWTRATLMFQKEVAERILAGPGSRKYGILSLSVALKARVEEVCEVPRRCFSPRPKVDSAVVQIEPLAQPRLPPEISEERFMALVRAAFQHRRKRAANSIAHALKLPQGDVETALERVGISRMARAEEISLDGFLGLAKALDPSKLV